MVDKRVPPSGLNPFVSLGPTAMSTRRTATTSNYRDINSRWPLSTRSYIEHSPPISHVHTDHQRCHLKRLMSFIYRLILKCCVHEWNLKGIILMASPLKGNSFFKLITPKFSDKHNAHTQISTKICLPWYTHTHTHTHTHTYIYSYRNCVINPGWRLMLGASTRMMKKNIYSDVGNYIHMYWSNYPQPKTHIVIVFYRSMIRAVEYADCISAERQDTPTMSVLIMTLNHLIVRFQSWSFGSCSSSLP